MIEILIPEYKRHCNSCYSDDDVKEIGISRKNDNSCSGCMIALRRKCREELKEKLSEE